MCRIPILIACLLAICPAAAVTYDCQATFVMEQVDGAMKRIEGGDIPPSRGHYTIDAEQGLVSVGDTGLFTFQLDFAQKGSEDEDTVLELGPSTRIALRAFATPPRFIHTGNDFNITYGECSVTKVQLKLPNPE